MAIDLGKVEFEVEVGVVITWIKCFPVSDSQASSTNFYPKYKMGNVDLTIDEMYQTG